MDDSNNSFNNKRMYFDPQDVVTIKSPARDLALLQASKINDYLEKCKVKNADELLSITDMEAIPKDDLLLNLQIAIPYKSKLKNFVQYINCLASELTSRGYAPKSILQPYIG
jgi:hypothetical protein